MVIADEVVMEQDMVWDYRLTDQQSERMEGDRQRAFSPDAEACLILAAKQGDLSAFNRLVLAHQDSVYRWAVSLVRDDMMADDITHLTFITAYEKLSTFRGPSMRAWLFTIARNRSIDALRSQKRHRSVPLEDDATDEEHGVLLSMLPADDPTPEEAVIRGEVEDGLVRLLDRLPLPYRQVLELVDLAEMDYQEAADVLSLPLGTVKSRVARARLKLREMLIRTGLL